LWTGRSTSSNPIASFTQIKENNVAKRLPDLARHFCGIRSETESLQELKTPALLRTAAGEGTTTVRARALKLLAWSRAPEAADGLRRVLGQTSEDAALRGVAAVQLARLEGPAAAKDLLAAMKRGGPPLFQIKVARAIGMVGGAACMADLAKLASSQDQGVAGQAAFSRMLVAFRSGQRGFEPKLPEHGQHEPVAKQFFSLLVESVSEDQIRLAMASRIDTYGTEPAWQDGLYVACGRTQHLVFSDARLLDRGIAASALQDPLVFGLVAQRASVDAAFSTRWLLLSWPMDRGRVRVAVYRPSGELAMQGSATIAGEEGRFTLRSRELNEPIVLRGALVGRRCAGIESASTASTSSFAQKQKRIPDLLRNFDPGKAREDIPTNDTAASRQ
jgi:hypothetical protein